MSNSSTPETLKSLESLYVGGKFDEAIKSLIAQKANFEIGPFHYNLGTLYAKKGEHAIARFHFEKAIKAGFIGDEVLNNLAYSTKTLQLDKVESDNLALDVYYSSFFSSFSILLMIIGIYFLLVLMFRKMQKISLKATTALLIVGVIPLVVKFTMNRDLKEAILLKKSAVKEGPSAIFESHQELPAGIKLIVTKPKDGWYLIKYPSHFSGWVQSADLGIL